MIAASEREALRQRLLAIDSANVADVLDELGARDQALSPELMPLASTTVVAGWAYTIRGQLTAYEGGDADKMQACQAMGPGDISVWAGDGDGVCCFGEMIAIGMRERGCQGAVVDGGIRDARWIAELGFPVFSRFRTPVQSAGRWKVTAWDVPVTLRGATRRSVTVHPGDFILGDADGVVVIPQALVAGVADRAEKLTRHEQVLRAALRAGTTLAEALRQHGAV